MEDVLIKMPTADVSLLTQMASRMGWTIERIGSHCLTQKL